MIGNVMDSGDKSRSHEQSELEPKKINHKKKRSSSCIETSSKLGGLHGSLEHIELRPDDVYGSHQPLPIENSGSSHSSSSSLASSSDDLFQLPVSIEEEFEDILASTSSNKKHKNIRLESEEHEVSASSINSEEEEVNPPGMASTSSVPDTTQESPSIQVMERSGENDPSRIPSRVFGRSKSRTRRDRSMASSESLFSIHIGSSSMSRELSLALKSEELMSGELLGLSHLPPRPSQSKRPSLSTVSIDKRVPFWTDKHHSGSKVPEIQRQQIETEKRGATQLVDETSKEKEAKRSPAEDQQLGPFVPLRNFDDREKNPHAFAYPVKKKSGSCFWCHCSCCNWALCCCARPRCSFRWLFFCFRWPSCCCNKCARPSCFCPSCSCCRCPSFCNKCAWPSCSCSSCCSCCSCPSCSSCCTCPICCFSWNCCSKRSCCCRSFYGSKDGDNPDAVKPARGNKSSGCCCSKKPDCCCCCCPIKPQCSCSIKPKFFLDCCCSTNLCCCLPISCCSCNCFHCFSCRKRN